MRLSPKHATTIDGGGLCYGEPLAPRLVVKRSDFVAFGVESGIDLVHERRQTGTLAGLFSPRRGGNATG